MLRVVYLQDATAARLREEEQRHHEEAERLRLMAVQV